MESKTITKLEEMLTQYESILTDKENEIREYEELCKSARERAEIATAESKVAFENTDTEAYHRALDDKRNNEDSALMYEKKAESVRKNPYISKEEYKQLIDEITSTIDQFVEAKRKDYAKLLEQVFKYRDEADEVITLGNRLYAIAQKKLFKDPCGSYTNSGVFIPHRWEEKKCNVDFRGVLDEMIRQPYNFDILSESHDRSELLGEDRKPFTFTPR